MKILEFFSGIGGMHYALKSSEIDDYEVVLSVDINPTANSIYTFNFPEVELVNRNIQSLSVDYLNKLGADTILMSPPCQPFTRNGLKRDTNDARTIPFVYILEVLPELNNMKNILIENVKGFENSNMRNLLIDTLKKCDFTYQEFLICPSQIGVPNSRLRYYCVAKKQPEQFNFTPTSLSTSFPVQEECKLDTISNYLEHCELDKYKVPMKILKKYWKVLDVCFKDSKRSCCFTKAYGRYAEGTGSVFTTLSPEKYTETCELINENNGDFEDLLSSLQLRYFTPKEISRLQCFPETFSFPDTISDRQKYMVLGNSINVKVVSKLINLIK